MKKMNSYRITAYLFLLVTITFANSCSKELEPFAPYIIPPPNSGFDTTTVGSTLKLAPILTNGSGSTTYFWTLDGQPVPGDTSYNFTATDPGDYVLVFEATNSMGSATQEYHIHVRNLYENGFFIINEGWYGNGSGTVSFYRYDTNGKEDSIFTKSNAGKDLGPNTSSLEFATVHDNKIYLLTKSGGPLVVADAKTMKETGRIASAVTNDFRALIGIDASKGLLSTSDGLYPLVLNTLAIGTKVPDITGEVADLTKSGNYIFALSAADGVVVLNAADLTVAKKIAGITVGFARTGDGVVWAAGNKELIRIDPASLDTTQIHLPFDINGTFGFWHPGSITASTKDNAVYIGANLLFSGATDIYKYVPGNNSSVDNPFISLPAGKELYGSGISYNAEKDQLVVSTVQSGWGTNLSINNLSFYDPVTGSLSRDTPYTGYFSPAMHVYH